MSPMAHYFYAQRHGCRAQIHRAVGWRGFFGALKLRPTAVSHAITNNSGRSRFFNC